jgi:hypothetical protein
MKKIVLLTCLFFIIIMSILVFGFFYGMGNHFIMKESKMTDSEVLFFESIKNQYGIVKCVKFNEIPDSKLSEFISGNKPKKTIIFLEVKEKQLLESEDNLDQTGKTIAKSYIKLINHDKPYL